MQVTFQLRETLMNFQCQRAQDDDRFAAGVLKEIHVSLRKKLTGPQEYTQISSSLNQRGRDFPHGKVVKTLSFHCRGHMLDPSQKTDPTCYVVQPNKSVQFNSVSHVRLFATPWAAARQASLSVINSQNLLKFISIESVMPSNHLILCHPLLPPAK